MTEEDMTQMTRHAAALTMAQSFLGHGQAFRETALGSSAHFQRTSEINMAAYASALYGLLSLMDPALRAQPYSARDSVTDTVDTFQTLPQPLAVT